MPRRFRVAAVLAASALAVSTSAGIAQAQSGELDPDSLSSVTGSLPGELGSTVEIGQGGEGGFIDTSGSLLGEPTFGSLAPAAGSVVGSLNEAAGSNLLNPAPGTGSLDTSGSLLGEPTTGSLAPVAGSVAGSLGSGSGSGDTGSLGPVLVVGGLAAVIALGVTFSPQIEQALADAGIQLPPMP